MILLAALFTLPLWGDHSTDHAHLLLGGPCAQDSHVVSLPTTEDVEALKAALLWAPLTDFGFYGGGYVTKPGEPFLVWSELDTWCGP